MIADKNKITERYKLALKRIENSIQSFKGSDNPVLMISQTYPGVWLEHVYDSVLLAQMDASKMDIAKNTINLFLDNQMQDGQLPYCIKYTDGEVRTGYSQIQECVSFTSLCLDYYFIDKNRDFLGKLYEKCCLWDNWLVKKRMTAGKNLIEMFCGFDTGHDNSGRWEDIKYKGNINGQNAGICPEDEILPLITPDMNAVFYGSRMALREMAGILGHKEEAYEWYKKAEDVKKALFDTCYDSKDEFFYDVDKNGYKRKYRSVSITNLFCEHFLDKKLAEKIYKRYLKNEAEFWTSYPFPSMSVSDLSFKQYEKGNSWGYFSQALTVLRCSRWMDYYGKSEDYRIIMEKWVNAWSQTDKIMFGQELDPISGIPSVSSEWYSSCMLFYIYAVKKLGLLE